jgi:hypothetical protein
MMDNTALGFHDQDTPLGVGNHEVGLTIAGAFLSVLGQPGNTMKDDVIILQFVAEGFIELTLGVAPRVWAELVGVHAGHSLLTSFATFLFC